MKHLKLSALIAIILFSVNIKNSNSQIASSKEAIEVAQMQLILSQRVVKDYLIIGINSNELTTKEAHLELKESVNLFNKNYSDLRNYITDNNIESGAELVNIHMYWELYSDFINTSPDKFSAETLIDLSLNLLNESETLITSLQNNSNQSEENEMLEICFKQKILSERIALFYMGKIWGVNYEKGIKKEYNKTRNEFKNALKTIAANEENTENINNNINVAKLLFGYDNKDFDVKDNYVAEVFDITQKLHNKIEDISIMYQELYSL